MNEQNLIEIAKREMERRQKISKTKTGGKHSDETRRKMRESQARRFAKMKKTTNAQTGE